MTELKTMHEIYGEPNDKLGKHICCSKCGSCLTCKDCKCKKFKPQIFQSKCAMPDVFSDKFKPQDKCFCHCHKNKYHWACEDCWEFHTKPQNQSLQSPREPKVDKEIADTTSENSTCEKAEPEGDKTLDDIEGGYEGVELINRIKKRAGRNLI